MNSNRNCNYSLDFYYISYMENGIIPIGIDSSSNNSSFTF